MQQLIYLIWILIVKSSLDFGSFMSSKHHVFIFCAHSPSFGEVHGKKVECRMFSLEYSFISVQLGRKYQLADDPIFVNLQR